MLKCESVPHCVTYDTSVGDKSTDGSEIRVNGVNQLMHGLGVRGIDLVRLCLYVEFFRNLARLIRCIFAAVVDDSDVSASLGDLPRDGESNTSVSTGDDDGFARL